MFLTGYFLEQCGQRKAEVFKNDDVKCRGQAKTIWKRHVTYVWTWIFSKTEKKIVFSKLSGYVWTGPLFTFHQKQEAELLSNVLVNSLKLSLNSTSTWFSSWSYICPSVRCCKHLLFHSNYKVFEHGIIKHGGSEKKNHAITRTPLIVQHKTLL